MTEGNDEGRPHAETQREVAEIHEIVEPISPEKELEELQLAVDEAAAENEALATDLKTRYVLLIKKAGKSPFLAKILQAKKSFDAKFSRGKESQLVQENKTPEEILSLRTDLPEQDRQFFVDYFNALPEEIRKKYHKRLTEILKNSETVGTITALRGATFEMSRWATIAKQGLETLDPSHGGTTITIDFLGYERKQKNNTYGESLPDHQLKNSPIEIDVPIIRDGEIFVYETKKFTRRAYGSEPASRNQLLKYQTAVEQQKIAGATVEISGRVDQEFLQWVIGQRVGDTGAVPQVEILYSHSLPSGKEYRFVLKRAQNKEGLQFTNEERYDETDLKIVRAIQQSVADKRIIDLICQVHINEEDASEELKPFLDDPKNITDVAIFDEYEALRQAAITRELNEIYQESLVNRDNRKGALNPEFANPSFIRTLIEEYQDFLAQNPTIAAIKSAYVLKPDQRGLAAERTMLSVQKIAEFEQKRQTSEEEQSRNEERKRMGYTGKTEGVALDIDHIIMDTVYTIVKDGFEKKLAQKVVGEENISLFFDPHPTKEGALVYKFTSQAEFEHALTIDPALKNAYDKMQPNRKSNLLKMIEDAIGRSYDRPERFHMVEQLPGMLEGQDRRYQEIHINDPKNKENPITRQTDITDAVIKRTEYLMLKENVKRAKEYAASSGRNDQDKKHIKNIESQLTVLNTESEASTKALHKTTQEQSREMQTQITSLSQKRTRLEKAGAPEEEIAAITISIDELNQKRLALFETQRLLSAENQHKEKILFEELEQLYKKIIPPKEWKAFAQKIIKRTDQNVIKFIYAVNADGTVMVQEEIIRGDVTGRAAHSELAQGRNIYGAGELAFEKQGNTWVLTEINNGSGHYRPDAITTLPYVKNLIAQKGIDVSRAHLVNSIMRGTVLKDASAF